MTGGRRDVLIRGRAGARHIGRNCWQNFCREQPNKAGEAMMDQREAFEEWARDKSRGMVMSNWNIPESMCDQSAQIAQLQSELAAAKAENVQDVANRVCGELPEGWVINLCIENGAAWVEVVNPSGDVIDIDGGDMTLVEQINEATRQAEAAEKGGDDE